MTRPAVVGPPSRDFERALSLAYRRGCSAGLDEVGTDLVLVHVAYYVHPRLGLPGGLWFKNWRERRAARGTLTDPALDLISPPENETVAVEADAVLRAAAFSGSDALRFRHRRKNSMPDLPVFSPAVRVAVYEAIREASWWGVQHARPEHLVVALLSVPHGAASRLAGGWTSGDRELVTTIRSDPIYGYDGKPRQWAIDSLGFSRVLSSPRPPWPVRALVWLSRTLGTRTYRRHGARYGHPILMIIEARAVDSAVRAGRERVTAADVLVTVIDFHEQLATAGRALPDDVARWNEAGRILAQHGVEGAIAARASAQLPSLPLDAEDDLAAMPAQGWPRSPLRTGVPLHGRTALTALREASLLAHRLGHPYAGTTHLLSTLLTEPNGPAARLLHALEVDVEAVRAYADSRLSAPPSADAPAH